MIQRFARALTGWPAINSLAVGGAKLQKAMPIERWPDAVRRQPRKRHGPLPDWWLQAGTIRAKPGEACSGSLAGSRPVEHGRKRNLQERDFRKSSIFATTTIRFIFR